MSQKNAQGEKGICPVCGEVVHCAPLRFDSEELEECVSRGAALLFVEHQGKEGCKTSSIVNERTGKVVRTFCDGSFRQWKGFRQ